jgi:hypothetical protein
MRANVLCGACVVAALSVAGCRQGDGTMPRVEGDIPNRIGDLSRDLMSVAGGEVQARQDLADDLRVFLDRKPDAAPLVDALSQRTGELLAGKPLTEQNSQKLAQQLWVAVAARDLSEKQIETLKNDYVATLTASGAAAPGAQQAAAQVETLQKAVGERHRRWYEVC